MAMRPITWQQQRQPKRLPKRPKQPTKQQQLRPKRQQQRQQLEQRLEQQRQRLEQQLEQQRQQQERWLLGLRLERLELLLFSSKQPGQRPAGRRSAGIFSFVFLN